MLFNFHRGTKEKIVIRTEIMFTFIYVRKNKVSGPFIYLYLNEL